MKLCSQKRLCSSKDDRDRLSDLPDDVIVRILSFLPIIDAVRTVLLRCFGNLWTWVHTLKFDYGDYVDNFCNWEKSGSLIKCYYHCFVRNVLKLHKNPSIATFSLCIEFNEVVDDLREYFRFALGRQAKSIKLYDLGNNDFALNCSLILPNLTSQFLVTLNLKWCTLEGELQVNLGSLKKLTLFCVVMSDEIFQSFISGCPSLHELHIVNPDWTNNLSFSAPNIDKLSLVFAGCSENGIDAPNIPFSLNLPNLRSLYLERNCWGLNIIDASSLRDIHVKYVNFPVNLYVDDPFTTYQMFEKLESVEVFQLSYDASEPFLRPIQCVQLLRHQWKHIILELHDLSDSCLSGIYHLMRSLKHLEELTIYTSEYFSASTDLLQLELPPPYVTPQLKTITLHGHGKTWRSQLQLIEFLLKSAAALDKLVIVPVQCRLKETEELEFVKQVANFPRASPSARVTFA